MVVNLIIISFVTLVIPLIINFVATVLKRISEGSINPKKDIIYNIKESVITKHILMNESEIYDDNKFTEQYSECLDKDPVINILLESKDTPYNG